MKGSRLKLRDLALGSRFRFTAPQWGIVWDGEVLRHGKTSDGSRAVVVRMDPGKGESPREEALWNPDLTVEILRDGPAG